MKKLLLIILMMLLLTACGPAAAQPTEATAPEVIGTIPVFTGGEDNLAIGETLP